MNEIIKIPKGQPFALFVPLVILNTDGSKEAVEADSVTDISVSLQCACETIECSFHTHERYIVIDLPDNLKTQEYAAIINATLPTGRPFALRIKRAFAVVEWDYQSNWRDYIIGEHIELTDTPLIAGDYITDSELENLKAQWRKRISEVEAVKAEYEARLHELQGLAQETTSQQILNAVGNIDFSSLAKQGSNPDATNTAILNTVNAIAPSVATIAGIEQEYTQGKAAIVAALRDKDISCPNNATLVELATYITNHTYSVGNSMLAVKNLTLKDYFAAGGGNSFSVIDDDTLDALPDSYMRYGNYSNLKVLILRKISTLGYSSVFSNATNLEVAMFPNISTVANLDNVSFNTNKIQIFDFGKTTRCNSDTYAIVNFTSNNKTLRHFYSGGYFPGSTYPNSERDNINRALSLYDLYFRFPITSSKNLNRWVPTSAINMSIDLLDKDKWDAPNEPTETFSTNKDKFAWYFEYRFLPAFVDLIEAGDSSNPTLTLHSVVYNFINTTYSKEQPTKTFIDIFTERGWTVASA